MKMYITYNIDTEQYYNFSTVEGKDQAECEKIAEQLTEGCYDTIWSEVIFPAIQARFELTEIPPQKETKLIPQSYQEMKEEREKKYE